MQRADATAFHVEGITEVAASYCGDSATIQVEGIRVTTATNACCRSKTCADVEGVATRAASDVTKVGEVYSAAVIYITTVSGIDSPGAGRVSTGEAVASVAVACEGFNTAEACNVRSIRCL